MHFGAQCSQDGGQVYPEFILIYFADMYITVNQLMHEITAR
jgi:hypothetical protein